MTLIRSQAEKTPADMMTDEEEIFSDEDHTDEHPYCDDVRHRCHTSVQYHSYVTGMHEPSDDEVACSLAFLSS